MARATPLNPLTVNAINQADGVYIIGVKANQAHLHRYCICRQLGKPADYWRVDEPQRGHGRCEERHYNCFRISPSGLDWRWRNAGFSTLLCVRRSRQRLDGSKARSVVSYFLSNAQPASDLEAAALFDAIRGHWRIEVMPHRRDVTAPAARLIRRRFTDEGAGDKSVDERLTNTGYQFVTAVKA